MTVVSTSSTHSSTPSPSPPPPMSSSSSSTSSPGPWMAIGVVLFIIGLILSAGSIWYTLRLKRRARGLAQQSRGQPQEVPHPASKITPFGSVDRHGPQFGAHNPGENMRIARRGSNGAWTISDARTPFTPSGVQEIAPLPSPSVASFRHNFPPYSPNSPMSPDASRASRNFLHGVYGSSREDDSMYTGRDTLHGIEDPDPFKKDSGGSLDQNGEYASPPAYGQYPDPEKAQT